MLKTVSGQPQIAKNGAYGLTFYAIIRIFARRDRLWTRNWKRFFRSVWKLLLGRGLYRVETGLFNFLASIQSEFVSVHILVFVTLFLFINVSWRHRGGVQFW